MARIYAGILGPLAMLTSLARGVIHGGGIESVLLTAWCALLAFAAVGYVLGGIANLVVEESVRARVVAELAAEQPDKAPETAAVETSPT